MTCTRTAKATATATAFGGASLSTLLLITLLAVSPRANAAPTPAPRIPQGAAITPNTNAPSHGAAAVTAVTGASAVEAVVTAHASLLREAPDGSLSPAKDLRLGEVITLQITVTAPRDAQLFEPMRPALGPFKVTARLPGTRKVTGAMATETYRMSVMAVRLGFEKLPAIEIPWRLSAEAAGSVSTAPVRVRVRGRLENEAAPGLANAPAPVDIITTNWALVWGLSIAGALLLAALLTWIVIRAMDARFRAMEPGPPPQPANIQALERLAALDATPEDALDGTRRLATVIDIMRQYLGALCHFDALEMTSAELTRELEAAAPEGVDRDQVAAMLADADLVKFAKLSVSDAQARVKSPVVRALVEASWSLHATEEDEEDAEEIIVLERATLKQRLYAGLVDGLLGGAVAVMLFAGLWITGSLPWGWTAPVVLGLWLFGRDAFGRSPGKRLLNLTIVERTTGQPPARPTALVKRNLLLVLWPLTLPAELLVLRRHPLILRPGDLIAGTEVVQGKGGPQ